MFVNASQNSRPPRRILLIKPSSLGDIVHALPILAALRRAYPSAHIAWLVATPFAPLLAGHALLDEVIPFDRRHYGRMLRSARSLADFVTFLRHLRQRRYDLVIDLQGLFRSGFMSWISGAARRVGFADARELAPLFYTRRVSGRRSAEHAVDFNLRIARALGLPAPADFPLGLRETELAHARELVTSAADMPIDRFCALLPAARWSSKCWPPLRHAALIDQLAADNLPPIVLLGSPADRQLADQIMATTNRPVINLIGRTTLRELAAILALSDLVICQDSGPMHIAAALNKPLVALFGPTNPARTGPYSPRARVVQLPLDCVPCYRRLCPLGHHHCMRSLDVETVRQAVLDQAAPLPRRAARATAAH